MMENEINVMKLKRNFDDFLDIAKKITMALDELLSTLKHFEATFENALPTAIRFKFIGIVFCIRMKYQWTNGVIDWGVIEGKESEEKFISLHTDTFDSKGNITVTLDKGTIQCVPDDYPTEFFIIFNEVISKYSDYNKNGVNFS